MHDSSDARTAGSYSLLGTGIPRSSTVLTMPTAPKSTVANDDTSPPESPRMCTTYFVYSIAHALELTMYLLLFVPLYVTRSSEVNGTIYCILFTAVTSTLCLVHLYYDFRHDIRDKPLEFVTYIMIVVGIIWSLIVTTSKRPVRYDAEWLLVIYLTIYTLMLFTFGVSYTCATCCARIQRLSHASRNERKVTTTA